MSEKSRGRPKKNWTQSDIAKDLGISQQSVSRATRIAKAIKQYPELIELKTGTV